MDVWCGRSRGIVGIAMATGRMARPTIVVHLETSGVVPPSSDLNVVV